uniref:Uncharacterized protein n=1 Tax=Aegilops tauschii subsp. strangulata TaxID=200361 RepID=A0A453MIG4_AEGTS
MRHWRGLSLTMPLYSWRWRMTAWDLHMSKGNLLPIQNPKEDLELLGTVEGSDTVFVTTDMGIYEINLNSLRWKKLWKTDKFCALIPYMSFYNR